MSKALSAAIALQPELVSRPAIRIGTHAFRNFNTTVFLMRAEAGEAAHLTKGQAHGAFPPPTGPHALPA
ncbi:hypothetical protein, partial [Methylibium sp.]|uniref:hypothetical protein n=1 Tax=Methylibium sp. TaxID=2067992 RepID=UPI00286CCFDC